MAQRIRKGDLVQVMTGNRKDRGKQGRVLAVDLERGRVRVEGVRIQKRHTKPGRAGARSGGIIEREGFLHASNVRLVDPKAGKPSRVRVESRDGRRLRVFVKSGETVPEPAAR
jgi:large subunit ribosomal protein L24